MTRVDGTAGLPHCLSFLLLAAAVTACSPRAFAERIVLQGGAPAEGGIPYGVSPQQVLDVYRPGASRTAAPVVVFLYGGRWSSGTRRDYKALAHAFTGRGWIVVVPDYRLYPDVKFPGWVEDGARAIRWTFDNAARLGGDTSRVSVVGHSAGGHTAALLALDERYLRTAGVTPGSMRAFVSIAGPVETTWTDPDIQALMGPREGWAATYPATFIDGTERPVLFLHGSDDRTVSYLNSMRLAERIRARGGCTAVRIYDGIGHVPIILAAMFPSLAGAPVLNDVIRFIQDPAAQCARGGGVTTTANDAASVRQSPP